MATDGNAKSQRTSSSTPPTADADAVGGGAQAETWRGLLGVLTDDELAKYGEVAQDQIDRELRWRKAQIAAAVAAGALMVWVLIRLFDTGAERALFYTLGLAAALVYWPYRGRRTRRLWQGHSAAVKAEQSRRAQGEAAHQA